MVPSSIFYYVSKYLSGFSLIYITMFLQQMLKTAEKIRRSTNNEYDCLYSMQVVCLVTFLQVAAKINRAKVSSYAFEMDLYSDRGCGG